jgi:type II secretion system protein D
MVSPFSSRRGGFLIAFVLAFNLLGGRPSFSQDAPNTSSAGFSNYQNTPVSSILDIYEQLSGKHLIRDSNLLTGVPNITINATGLSKPEMLKMIEATLLLNGVAIVPVDSQTVKIIAVGQAKNPRSEGIKLYANAADLPPDDEVVSYYMPLSYISAQEAQTIFTQNAPVHSYGMYVPAPSAQAVVITENTSVIRELIALKELIDVPPASVVSEFIQLNRADAEKVADLLNKLLAPPTNTPNAPNAGGPVIVPADVGNREPLLNEHNLLSGPAQIIPDTRSNRILIVTRPVNMPFMRQLVEQLDQPDIYMVPQRRPLKYVLAQDILPALEAALAQGKDEEKEIGKDQGSNTTNPNNNPQSPAASSSGGSSSSGAGTVSSITPQLQAPPENNVPTVVTIGKTRLLADNRSNSIIVFGSPDVTGRVFGMIDELDRKPLQVYLATVIGELSLTNGEEFGVDLLQKYAGSGLNGAATASLTTGPGSTTSASVPNPTTLLNSTIFPLASGLTVYGLIGGTLNAYVRALETTDRFKIISRPSVYTTNNKLAVIASGSQVPVPSNITSGFADSSSGSLTTTANIVYQNVLLQLDIIPLINANHEVTLKIRQTDNTIGPNNVISGNNVPTINTQEINTEVTVKDKSTVVIGGLISDTNKRDTTGVPFLSDIPVLGYLFKDTSKTKERDELIIMIQPSVVETETDQIAVDEAEKKRTILGQEAQRAATGFSEDVPKTFQLPPLNSTTTTQTTTVTKPTYNSKGTVTTKTSTTTTSVQGNPNP